MSDGKPLLQDTEKKSEDGKSKKRGILRGRSLKFTKQQFVDFIPTLSREDRTEILKQLQEYREQEAHKILLSKLHMFISFFLGLILGLLIYVVIPDYIDVSNCKGTFIPFPTFLALSGGTLATMTALSIAQVWAVIHTEGYSGVKKRYANFLFLLGLWVLFLFVILPFLGTGKSSRSRYLDNICTYFGGVVVRKEETSPPTDTDNGDKTDKDTDNGDDDKITTKSATTTTTSVATDSNMKSEIKSTQQVIGFLVLAAFGTVFLFNLVSLVVKNVKPVITEKLKKVVKKVKK